MRASPHRILLVGKNLANSAQLRSFLTGMGALPHCSETLADAASLVRRRRFDVVLGPTKLPEGTSCLSLKDQLVSPASFILSVPVESTYLWLPVLWKGQYCWGTSTLRPSEFALKLRELLGPPRFVESRSCRTLRRNAPPAVFTASTNVAPQAVASA
jgi:hypothetical protein